MTDTLIACFKKRQELAILTFGWVEMGWRKSGLLFFNDTIARSYIVPEPGWSMDL